jgi:hypothetical protein
MQGMFKVGVVVLLLANLIFGVWSHGAGAGRVGEPERLARQVRPQLVQVLSPVSAASAPRPVAPLGCLEAGPFNSAGELAAAQAAMKVALPKTSASRWAEVKTESPGVWMLYVGKFANAQAQERKTQELSRRNIIFELLSDNPIFSPGFSLGRFGLRASANNALEELRQRGVRTARVVEITAPVTQYFLRAPNIERELVNQLKAVQSNALGLGFKACAVAVL